MFSTSVIHVNSCITTQIYRPRRDKRGWVRLVDWAIEKFTHRLNYTYYCQLNRLTVRRKCYEQAPVNKQGYRRTRHHNRSPGRRRATETTLHWHQSDAEFGFCCRIPTSSTVGLQSSAWVTQHSHIISINALSTNNRLHVVSVTIEIVIYWQIVIPPDDWRTTSGRPL